MAKKNSSKGRTPTEWKDDPTPWAVRVEERIRQLMSRVASLEDDTDGAHGRLAKLEGLKRVRR